MKGALTAATQNPCRHTFIRNRAPCLLPSSRRTFHVGVKSSDLMPRHELQQQQDAQLNCIVMQKEKMLGASSSMLSLSDFSAVCDWSNNNNVITNHNNISNSKSAITSNDEEQDHQQNTEDNSKNQLGDRMEEKWSRWGKKHFGNIFNAPKNYAYPFSKYWAKRYRMKKHRYRKRWRLRRYKLAALANLPFAKKLRVNMMPSLRSTKKKATTTDVDSIGAVEKLVGAAQEKATSKRAKSGTGLSRARPKSKYQS